jgi:DNA-binding Lrp family transcriptional regulator
MPLSSNETKPRQRDDLDSIDLRILAELQADGRITNVDLAQKVGSRRRPACAASPPGGAGVLRGYHAEVDPAALGFEVTFFALVGLESQKQAVLDAFEREAAAWPEVRECHMIRGGGDFLLRPRRRDTAHENELTRG